MKQPSLKTKRLLLRTFKQQDAGQVQALAGNENVSKSTLNIPHPYKDGMAEDWIDSHEMSWESKSKIIFAITKLYNKQLIGTVGLVEITRDQAEIGYWIGEPFWGNGYCTEATKALINFSFTQLGLNKLIGVHLASNPASGKVMEKAGMLHIKSDKIKDRFGAYVDAEIYEIEK